MGCARACFVGAIVGTDRVALASAVCFMMKLKRSIVTMIIALRMLAPPQGGCLAVYRLPFVWHRRSVQMAPAEQGMITSMTCPRHSNQASQGSRIATKGYSSLAG